MDSWRAARPAQTWSWEVGEDCDDASFWVATRATEPDVPVPEPARSGAPSTRWRSSAARPPVRRVPPTRVSPTRVDEAPTPTVCEPLAGTTVVEASDGAATEIAPVSAIPPLAADEAPLARVDALPAPAAEPSPPVDAARPIERPAREEETVSPPEPRLVRDPPPPIPAPAGLVEEERAWLSPDVPPMMRFGCCSHRGPEWTWKDKDNEDFAFAVERAAADGERWVLAGVCDGVSNSTWSERGAKHAAAAFIEVVTRELQQGRRLDAELQRADGKRAFAEAFQRRTKETLDADARMLLEGRYVHPTWKKDLYEHTFLDGHRSAEKRKEWFQTTLLAAALGPRGGFALLLGDGFVRVDRHGKGDRVQRKIVSLQTDGTAPELCITLSLTVEEVVLGLRGVLPEHSVGVGVVMATDGVSKSPRHGLEDTSFRKARECRSFLQQLAGRGKGQVESDNMSVAFAYRETTR